MEPWPVAFTARTIVILSYNNGNMGHRASYLVLYFKPCGGIQSDIQITNQAELYTGHKNLQLELGRL